MTYDEAIRRLKGLCSAGEDYRVRDAVIDEVNRLRAQNKAQDDEIGGYRAALCSIASMSNQQLVERARKDALAAVPGAVSIPAAELFKGTPS